MEVLGDVWRCMLPRNPDRAGLVGRPRIGVKVDFCVPEDTDAEIRYVALRLGVPVDAVYREVVSAGIAAMRCRRTESL
jgi:hypothetical protein